METELEALQRRNIELRLNLIWAEQQCDHWKSIAVGWEQVARCAIAKADLLEQRNV